MKTKLLVLLIFACLIVSNKPKAQVNVGDSLALVDLYNSTGGDHWVSNYYWLTKQPVSRWYGITVVNQRVSKIEMAGNSLRGVLPLSIGNLDSLSTLMLVQNSLTGNIPASLGNIANIDFIDLSKNLLSGEIPKSIGSLQKLQYFNVFENRLTGMIPDTLGNCNSLAGISLNNNKLTGTIPTSIKNLANLVVFDVSYNHLSGGIPDIFFSGSQLSYLNISHNQFTGTIPDSIGYLKELETLDMYENRLTGSIPNSIGQLTKLEYVRLQRNQLSGVVPSSFKNLINLYYFFIYDNQLTDEYNLQDAGKVNKQTYMLLQKNRLTFNSLEKLVKKYETIAYAPQAAIKIHGHQTYLAVSAGGTLANNTYHWFAVGKAGAVTVTGDSTFRPTKSGNYYARVNNSIATKLTLTTDTVEFSISANELNISLSPNPAKDRITIHGLNEKSSANITIADMSGYTWVKTFSRQQSALAIDVSRLKAGNYLVNVNDGKEVKTIQFVKE